MSNAMELEQITRPTARQNYTGSTKGSVEGGDTEVGPATGASSTVEGGQGTPPGERTRKMVMTDHLQFFAACWSMVLAGWNDGTTGPLLPRIQQVYNVRRGSVAEDASSC